MRTTARFLFCILLTCLAGCSSGSGSGSRAVGIPGSTGPQNYFGPRVLTAEAVQSAPWGHAVIGASALHRAGISGAGVEIGIADEFFAQPSTTISPEKLTCLSGGCVGRSNEDHGHLVATVAAGDWREGIFAYGVAYNARIRFHGLNLGSGGGDYEHTLPTTGISNFLANALRDLHGSDVVNMSFGIPNISSDPETRAIAANVSRDLVGEITASGGRAIYVASAGNSNERTIHPGSVPAVPAVSREVCPDDVARPENKQRQCLIADSPSFYAAMGYFFPEALAGRWIASVAINPSLSGEQPGIAYFSQRCGIVGENCIAAPGFLVQSIHSDGEDDYVSGTSFSAPYTVGALALLIDYFTDDETGEESLSRPEITARLFATADKSGFYAPDAVLDEDRNLSTDCKPPASTDDADTRPVCAFSKIYGQGVVDVENAIAPQGGLFAALGKDIHHASLTRADEARFIAPPAFGDALTAGGPRIALFDALKAPFFFPFGSFTRPAPAVQARVERGADETGSPLALLAGEQQGGWQRGKWRMGFFGQGGARPAYGMAAAYEISRGEGAAKLALNTGFLFEEKSLLGGYGLGGFGAEAGSGHFFTGFRFHIEAPLGLDLLLRGDLGFSRAEHAPGLLAQKITPLLSSAFALEIARRGFWRPHDRLGIKLSQPLRVERGAMEIHYASGRTAEGAIHYARSDVPLSPSGREVVGELFYAPGEGLRLSAAFIHDAGHRRGRQAGRLTLAYRSDF